jgi:hypothetical protein
LPREAPGRAQPTTLPREEPWHWRLRGRDEGRDTICDVALGEDGKALAVGAMGVRFWDGGGWLEIPLPEGVARDAFKCVARLDPDRYALGGHGGLLAFLTRGSWQLLRGADATVEYTALWGNEQGVLVAAGRRPGRSAVVWCARNGEWLPPKKMPGIRAIHSLAPHIGGNVIAAGDALPRDPAAAQQNISDDGLVGALVAVSTGNGELRDLRPPDGEMPRIFSVATSRFGEAVVVGAGGFAARVGFGPHSVEIRPERVETRKDLKGARFDAASQVWAVASGRIVARTIAADGRPVWRRIWWGAGDGPALIRVYSSGDRLLGFSREGLVVEGRAMARATRSERPPPP